MPDSIHQLFNVKTIQKLCSSTAISDEQNSIALRWIECIKNGTLKQEVENYPQFANFILDGLLGYPVKEEWKLNRGKIEFSFKSKNGLRTVGIEAKGTSVKDLFAIQHREKREHETPVKQTWDYMGINNFDYGICTNYRHFVLIDKTKGYSKYHLFDFLDIEKDKEKLKEFVAIFSNQNVLENEFILKLYEESILEEREFTKEFYKLYHETRLMLIKEFEHNSLIDKKELIHFAQLFLNRIIFIFFAEDSNKIKKRLFEDSILKILEVGLISEHSRYVTDTIVNLFKGLDKGSQTPVEIFGFNGGLFGEPIPNEIYFKDLNNESFFKDVLKYSKLKNRIQANENAKKILDRFGNKLNPIIKNLLNLASFDFQTELNVNILGHIFEQSISDLEELKEISSISTRKKGGIYYTPEYITDFICKNTIIPYFSNIGVDNIHDLINEYSNNIDDLEKKFKEIKILDPACGSGAFLIKAVDILLEIYRNIQEFKESIGKYTVIKKNKRSGSSKVFSIQKWNEQEEAREIIKNNIFGVDINEESVEITKLSLFLKIASYNRKLINLNENIKIGDSLIDDKSLSVNAFNWNEFKEIFEKHEGFDIVIGNPPYGRYGSLNHSEKDHLKKHNLLGNTYDISESFILLSLTKLLRNDGYFGFVIPKGFSYVTSWKNARKLFLDNYKLLKLIDISSAFEDVLYEQLIIVAIKGNHDIKEAEIGSMNPTGIQMSRLEFKFFNERIFPIDLSERKVSLLRKIESNCSPIKKYMNYWYGKGGLTPFINTQRYGIKLLTGKEIIRYGFKDNIEPWYIDKKFLTDMDYERALTKKVVVQDIVAHIIKPFPHIKITAALDTEERLCLNTVMCFSEMDDLKNEFLVGILNSQFISYYYYYYVFNQAIRTMHFMPGYADYLPIPSDYYNFQDKIIKESNSIRFLTHKLIETKRKFRNRLMINLSISTFTKKLDNFFVLSFTELIKEIHKTTKRKLSLKEQDEWEEYFNIYKKNILDIKSQIKQNEIELNKLVFELYQLSSEEIEVISRELNKD